MKNNGCLFAILGIIILIILLFFKPSELSNWYLAIPIIFVIVGMLINTDELKKYQNEEYNKKGIDTTKFIQSGKYISGHTHVDTPKENTFIYLKDNELKIYFKDKTTFMDKFLANIPIDKIINVVLEDESSIQSRVGFKRLIGLGIFAFALKKKEKYELAYIVIDWEDGKFKTETVFEFEGNSAILKANTMKNAIINFINKN